jgi:Domain of unknown function (DUF4184)
MPFTLAHPAAVIYLKKWVPWLFSTSGLLVGCMVPDFEAYVFQNERKIYGHSWLGIFWFDLPLALVCLLVFHGLVKIPLFYSLPKFTRKRLAPYLNTNWMALFRRNAPKTVYSILIGSATHLLWDAFTHMDLVHPHGLDSGAYLKLSHHYVVLQYASSVIGLALCLYFFLKLPRPAGSHSAIRVSISGRLLFWAITAMVAFADLAWAYHRLQYTATYVFAINSLMGGCILGWICASLILWRRFPRKSESML